MYAPKAQQIEGLTVTSKNVPLETYIRSIKSLRRANWISKSRAIWILKVIRKAKGIAYEDFIKLYRRIQ